MSSIEIRKNLKDSKKRRYQHYKNKQIYTIVSTCKIQLNDIWVCGIEYTNESGMKFVRPKIEFMKKFKKC